MTAVMDLVRVGVAELVGTIILVLVGCLGCVYTIAPVGGIGLEQIALTFGFAVMCCVQIFAHISGGHVNPAVTVAAVILGKTKLFPAALVYVIAQILGGIIGFVLLRAVTPDKFFNVKRAELDAVGICSTVPNKHISVFQALLVEFLITFVLILLCASVWDPRNAKNTDGISIKFGLAIAGLAMAGGHYTGGSMNPARSFGPSLINNDWAGHWIYWVGPLLAGAAGGGFYRLLYGVKAEAAPPPNP